MEQEDPDFNDVLDPEFLLGPSSSSDFSANMDKIFAEDDAQDLQISGIGEEKEKKKESSQPPAAAAKPNIFRKGVTFWNGKAIAYLLTGENTAEKKVHLVLINKQDKKVLRRICVDEVVFSFQESEFAVKIENWSVEGDDEELRLAFLDRFEYQAFCLTILIRSNSQEAFIISEGSGENQIDEDTVILYSLAVHKTDEEGLALPITSEKIKRKLDAEKLESHKLYKWLRGLRRGCQVFVKVSDGVVNELVVLKDKKHTSTTTNSAEASDQLEIVPEAELARDALLLDDQNENQNIELVPTPCPRTSLPPSESTIVAPAPSSSSGPDNVRDTLHRIIGIELDRIEMRLNAKFEQFRVDVNSRLDHQTALLQQLLDANTKK